MLQKDIIPVIEKNAPLSLAADWDHSGMQVTSVRTEVRTLAVCLDPTPRQILNAANAGAEMLLTHHPLSLAPQWTGSPCSHTDCLRLLYSRDIALYSSHTTLDANPSGPSAWLPDELGLTCRTMLEPCGTFQANGMEKEGGFGCAGILPKPAPLSEVCLRIRNLLPLDRMCAVPRLIGDPHAMIEKIAVCTGSGGSLINAAAASGADLYITGDVKYHDALPIMLRHDKISSDFRPMAVLDVGHFSLEEEMMRRFAGLLQQQLGGVSVVFLPGRDPFLPVTFLSEVPEVLS